ncbi:VOC family protein [Deinococcus hopiensis]|uniref:Catechol 2,3-dioxygenase n=1 Tax=Deinococcus hopiensis KR-140 TaxID=695939 RepID=A0A1W1VUW0_9DEIO|nr:VOC family protein [Deinococcus hopiensis]SMB97172.1 catechol 2,3-dioxygenase [Deinococcus hopiensis KR-140]
MTSPASQAHRTAPIDPKLSMGEVALTVRNLGVAVRFYTLALGLTLFTHQDGQAVLGTPDGHPLVTLYGDPQAPTPPANATGLYHLAVAFPTRPDLARWLKHAAALGLQLGQNNHKTHEAFYFSDPEGNGIELYHDWPREQWPFKDGRFASFDGVAIDIQDLLGTLAGNDAGWTDAPVATRMGHVHLKMSDTDATRTFYRDVMGFDITADGMGAVFAAAGGYHHHLGNNAWHSRGGPKAPDGALGLRHYTLELSSGAELDAVTARLKDAGVAVLATPAGQFTRDPAGNRMLLRAGPSTIESALAALSDTATA